MLHAAAMLTGISLIWLLVTQRWNAPQDFAIALGVGAACVAASWRFGGIGRAFAEAPSALMRLFAGARLTMAGAWDIVRSALAADIELRPALVRVKHRSSAAASAAAIASAINANPAMIVVETDAEGILAHVINENDAVVGALERLGGERGA